MDKPKFSILIPTRDRPATFRHTLATAVTQGGDDYEVVVADNCSSPATRLIVEEAAARPARIVYLRSDEILPMAENWERGLRACGGEYITVLGDDDGLLPSTLPLARRIIQHTQTPVLSWALHTYWWPDTIAYWNANRLFLAFGDQAVWLESREVLKDFYAGRIGFGNLPMIYCSFVHRSIIERASKRFGSYFASVNAPPDVSSGIINLLFRAKFVHCTRPLAVRGNSGKSNGVAQWMRSLGGAQRDRYLQEERAGWEDLIHPSLVASPNLQILIASTKLKCRERYFPNDPELQVKREDLVREILANLNFEPEAYDENLADARALATKIGMDLAAEKIPAKQPRERRLTSGLTGCGEQITGIAINCDLAGAFNVADAARIAESASAPHESFASMPETYPPSRPPR